MRSGPKSLVVRALDEEQIQGEETANEGMNDRYDMELRSAALGGEGFFSRNMKACQQTRRTIERSFLLSKL